MEIKVGDILTMKKSHPCSSSTWKVLRAGMDFRIKCEGCGHQLMLSRVKVEKSIRKINGIDPSALGTVKQ